MDYGTEEARAGVGAVDPNAGVVRSLPTDNTATTLSQLSEEGQTAQKYQQQIGEQAAGGIEKAGQAWASAIGTAPAKYYEGVKASQDTAMRQTQQALANQQLKQATRDNDLGEKYGARLKEAQTLAEEAGAAGAQTDLAAKQRAEKYASAPNADHPTMSNYEVDQALARRKDSALAGLSEIQTKQANEAFKNETAITAVQAKNPDGSPTSDQQIMAAHPNMDSGTIAQARQAVADRQYASALNQHLSLMQTSAPYAAAHAETAKAMDKQFAYVKNLNELAQFQKTFNEGHNALLPDSSEAIDAKNKIKAMAVELGMDKTMTDEIDHLFNIRDFNTQGQQVNMVARHMAQKMNDDMQNSINTGAFKVDGVNAPYMQPLQKARGEVTQNIYQAAAKQGANVTDKVGDFIKAFLGGGQAIAAPVGPPAAGPVPQPTGGTP